MSRSSEATAAGDPRRVRQILLATRPSRACSPPQIAGSLYVDGGVTGNILCGVPPNRLAESYTFFDRWREVYPGAVFPKVRYWVIFNNELRWPPEVVQAKWSSVLKKSLTAATRAATVNSMRQLFLQAEIARLRHGADVEVRVVAVPDGWVAPLSGAFEKKTMNVLADLGEAQWRGSGGKIGAPSRRKRRISECDAVVTNFPRPGRSC